MITVIKQNNTLRLFVILTLASKKNYKIKPSADLHFPSVIKIRQIRFKYVRGEEFFKLFITVTYIHV